MLEGAWYLRGLENFLMDLASNLDFVNDLLDHTMQHSLTLSKELVKMGVDILWWGDDFSMETGPLMQPELFRDLLKSRYAQAFGELRQIDSNVKIAFHHTIQSTPRAVENTIAYYWAAHAFRDYPINLMPVIKKRKATRVQ